MSSDDVFNYALAVTLEHEGGYNFDPRDPGGETNMGISKRAYPNLDIKNLTREEVAEIYRRDYWDRIRADRLPPAIAVVAFDIAVNSGPTRLLEWLAERPHDAVTLSARRMEHFTNLKELWPIFGRGWSRRTTRVLEAAHALTAQT